MKKSPLLLLLALCTMAFAAPTVHAQAYRGQVKFLEDFAIREYNRGDHASATREFQRILRIDPNDAVALDYLKKLSALPNTPGTPAPQRIDQIISDITLIKSDLSQYESEIKDLEYLIRNLISENDALYQVLYKRSREVAELRSKFYGTPYAQAYAEVMKDLPIDRVPQRLHPSNDILPDSPAPGPRPESSEDINKLIAEIVALEEHAAGKTLFVERSQAMPQVDKALTEKREALIKKTMVTAEKYENLSQVKEQLWDINASLRQSDARYMEALKRLEDYYTRIKEEVSKKNSAEQKMFDELMTDYAAKVKEIESLKETIRARDNALTSFKPALTQANDQIQNNDKTVAARDKALRDIQALLEQYKKDLAEKDAVIKDREKTIQQQQGDLSKKETVIQTREITIRGQEQTIQQQQGNLSLTDKKLDDVNTQVTGIELTLQDGDANLAKIQQDIDRAKDIISQQKASMTAQNEAAIHDTVRVKEMEARCASLEALIAVQENAIKTSNRQIKNLEQKISGLTTELGIKEEELNAPAKQAKEKKIAELENSLTDQKNFMTAKDAEWKKIKNEEATLRQTLLDTAAQVTSKSKELSDTSSALKALREEAAANKVRILELSEQLAVSRTEQRSLRPITNGQRAQDKDIVSDLEARLRSSMNKLTETENSLIRATSELSMLKEKLTNQDVQAEKLNAIPAPAPAVIDTYKAERNDLTNALVVKDEELTAIRKQLENARTEADILKNEKKILTSQISKLTSAPPPAPEKQQPPQIQPPAEDVRSLTLDVKEKETAITKLQADLASTEKALSESQAKVKAFSETRSVQDIKQEAITKLIDERDDRIAALSTQIYALKQDLSTITLMQKELKTKTEEALSAKTVSEGKLQSREDEIAVLQVKVKELQDDIKRSTALIDKKNRDHDATLAELKRINDTLEKKAAEITDLQQRLNKKP